MTFTCKLPFESQTFRTVSEICGFLYDRVRFYLYLGLVVILFWFGFGFGAFFNSWLLF